MQQAALGRSVPSGREGSPNEHQRYKRDTLYSVQLVTTILAASPICVFRVIVIVRDPSMIHDQSRVHLASGSLVLMGKVSTRSPGGWRALIEPALGQTITPPTYEYEYVTRTSYILVQIHAATGCGVAATPNSVQARIEYPVKSGVKGG